MNLQSFLKTLESYGYNTQYIAQVLTTVLKVYTEYTYGKKVTPSKDTGLLAAFRLLSNKNGYYILNSNGIKIAEELIGKRAHEIADECMNPETFFVLKCIHPHLNEPEIQFLLSRSRLATVYNETMDFLRKSGLAYTDNGIKAPRNLHTFFEFPFEEDSFEKALRLVRSYIRFSPLNKRVMKVTFSDMKSCKKEVLNYIKDMRKQGIIKEFVRDKGYTFRVLDAQEYQLYIQNILNTALVKLRFIPPAPEYSLPVNCGWDSVGLLDQYPVPEGTPMNILLFGDPGPLKQIWSQHYLYGELQNGCGGIYLCISSPPRDIRKNFQRFNKDISAFEGNTFQFVDGYPKRQTSHSAYYVPIDTSSLTDFGMMLSDVSQDMGPDHGVVVFDSLSTLMLYFEPEQVIKFAVNQASRLKEREWTGIFIVEKGVNDERIENSLKFLLDGVFEIRNSEFIILWIQGIVDKPVRYALDISERGLILLPKR
jgi:KaiC/GvpD/RAD55 family RecA-like ATPase